MLEWINSHGIECVLICQAVSLIAGTMPPLTDNASYWSRWAYTLLHAAALNINQMREQMTKVKAMNGYGQVIDGGFPPVPGPLPPAPAPTKPEVQGKPQD